jgi:hypothetical protein
LKPENYGVVEKLLNKMDMSLQVEAIITGKAVGDVLVDDLNEPSFALLLDYGHNFYLVSDHARNLNRLNDKVFSTCYLVSKLTEKRGYSGLLYSLSPPSLEDELTKGLRDGQG